MSLPLTYNGHGLTRRQLEILAAVGREGHATLAAKRLHLSEQTVKNHLGIVYRKLGVNSIAAALWVVFVPDTEA